MDEAAPAKRPMGRRLLAAALSLGLSAVAAETVVRVRYPPDATPVAEGALHEPLRSCAYAHSTRGWAIRPGACGRDASGLLGTDSPDAWRLLVIGDSVAEGTWVDSLGQALAARTGRSVAVRNAAVAGYNVCQEAATLRERLDEVDPHAVLVQTCSNDLQGSVTSIPDGAGWSLLHTVEGWRRVPTLALRSRIFQILVLPRPAAPDRTAWLGDQAADCAADLAGYAASRGVPLVVLHFPALVDPWETDPLPQGLLQEEQAIQRAWAGVDAPQLDGRRLLSALGPLSALAPRANDRLHPASETGPGIGAALAPAVAAALGLPTAASP